MALARNPHTELYDRIKNQKETFSTIENIVKNNPHDSSALVALGCCHYCGYGVPKDTDKGIETFSQAAMLGNDVAFYNLGLIYHDHKNLSIARYFYLESIRLGNNRSKENLDLITKTLDEDTKAPSYSFYDAQVVIDFLSKGPYFSSSAHSKIRKWNKNQTSLCYVMTGTDLMTKRYQFTQSDNKLKLRIYIIGHCWIGNDVLIYEDNKQTVHYNELADALAKYIGTHEAIVSLLTCGASKGLKKNSEDSFAAKLHLALYNKLNRDTPLIARESLSALHIKMDRRLTFNIAVQEEYKPNYNQILSLNIINDNQNPKYFIHHQPHSKFIFMRPHSKQVKLDAYEYLTEDKWKIRVLETLAKLQSTPLINAWLVQFPNESAYAIYKAMRDELANYNYTLRFFLPRSQNEKSIAELVKTGTTLFASKYKSEWKSFGILRW